MQSENKPLARTLNIWASVISVVVIGLVSVMRKIHIDLGIDFSFLPGVYAIINSLVAVCLLFALYFISKKQIENHRRAIYFALGGSTLFLLLYVLYHITTPHTEYCGEGNMRLIYFLLLISHVVLAAGSFPFILFTFIRGFTWQVAAHKRMARWVFWVWLYVAITGPICYLMLLPCYN